MYTYRFPKNYFINTHAVNQLAVNYIRHSVLIMCVERDFHKAYESYLVAQTEPSPARKCIA